MDVAVVGASFAGLACARAAATRGLRTVVLEKAARIGARPHTTGLLTKEAAELLAPPLPLTRKLRRVRLYAPSLRSIDLAAPGYYFLATDTEALMRWLAEDATRTGAEVRLATPYRGGRPARWVIGADGARSTVARRFGLGVNRRFLVGTEVELTGVSGLDPECLHCLLDSRLAPGYLAWAFTGVATTQVGLACVAHWRPDLRAWLERLGGLCDMSRARVVARRGGLIPVGGVVAPCHAPQVMLIGDAAGVVSPLSAGGIHTALSTGRLAAHLLADHLLDGGLEPGTLLARRLPRFRLKRIARRLLELRPPGIALDALLESRAFRAAAARIFFHRRAHPRRRASGESVLDPRC